MKNKNTFGGNSNVNQEWASAWQVYAEENRTDSTVDMSSRDIEKNKNVMPATNYDRYGNLMFNDGADLGELIRTKYLKFSAGKPNKENNPPFLNSPEDRRMDSRVGDLLTSCMRMDDGSFMFTHNGYFGRLKTNENGEAYLDEVYDITQEPEDFNPYEGVKIGEKIDGDGPVALGLTIFHCGENMNGKLPMVGGDEPDYENFVKGLDGQLEAYFEDNRGIEYSKMLPHRIRFSDEFVAGRLKEGKDIYDAASKAASADANTMIVNGVEVRRNSATAFGEVTTINADTVSKNSPESKNSEPGALEVVGFDDLKIDPRKQTELTGEILGSLQGMNLRKTEINDTEYIFLPSVHDGATFAIADRGKGEYGLNYFTKNHENGSWMAFMDGDSGFRNVLGNSPFMRALEGNPTWGDVWDEIHGEGTVEDINKKISHAEKNKLPLLTAGKEAVDYRMARGMFSSIYDVMSEKIKSIHNKK